MNGNVGPCISISMGKSNLTVYERAREWVRLCLRDPRRLALALIVLGATLTASGVTTEEPILRALGYIYPPAMTLWITRGWSKRPPSDDLA